MNARSVAAACLVSLIVLAAAAQSPPAACLQFTKKGHIACGDVFNVAEGTIEFWVKPTTNANNEWVISKRLDADRRMEFGFGPTTFMIMVMTNGQRSYVG